MDRGKGAFSRSAAALAAALLAALVLASSAGALVVKLPDGQALGITPRVGVAPASIPGAHAATTHPNVVDNGNVVYQGGPVVHSSAPYLIFWDPSSAIPAPAKTLMKRYFTDVAHDGGLASNVYGVLRQYSDQTGTADYQQTFTPAQAIVDTHAYPTPDTTNCIDNAPADESACITDTQLQSELTRLIATQGLPTDGLAGVSELVPGAPIYFIVTPGDVNLCAQGPSKGKPKGDCADNLFCAYHSSYRDGANNVLYSPIPLINALVTDPPNHLNPKFCQGDNNAAVQKPNGDGGDVALKYLSHEDSETITDPLGTGWFNSASGNEVGDNCNFWNGGQADVTTGNEPNAFLPTLGGSVSPILFDQLINGNQYYIQSEWSNGNVDCAMQPAASTLTPSFTVPSGIVAAGGPVGFDPAATSSSGGYSSIGWSFGDGATTFASTATTGSLAPTSVSHIYAATGTYTVTLSVVDTHGNVATATHTVSVANPPSATFTASTTDPLVGDAVSFNGAGSSDPNAGASITGYSWSFGDGGTARGATTSHAYGAAGEHTVILTVIDSLGLSSSVSKLIDVLAGGPAAAFTFSPRVSVPGHAVAFNAAGSSDPNAGGSISSYSWSFGDGGVATGAATSHTYGAPGIYLAHLSVADGFGLSANVTHLVFVTAPGAPTSSPGSLSGVAKGKPRLAFELRAGMNAPGLLRAVVGLPSGLTFAKKGLITGVTARAANGQRLVFAAKLSNGKLTVTLNSATSAVKLTITARALAESRKLKRRVSTGKVRSLAIAVMAIDSAGTATPLTLTPNV
ncbi:MAG: PKD domain-containing protein [Actinomycetota bacterium]|nr:PKD domain-containing protein [Actinomycetota bacterium]